MWAENSVDVQYVVDWMRVWIEQISVKILSVVLKALSVVKIARLSRAFHPVLLKTKSLLVQALERCTIEQSSTLFCMHECIYGNA